MLNARSSEALGRPFAIAGDLGLTWEKQVAGPGELDQGWRGMIPWPHLLAQDVRIGNPPDMTAPAPADASAPLLPADMASIKRVVFSLNPLALF